MLHKYTFCFLVQNLMQSIELAWLASPLLKANESASQFFLTKCFHFITLYKKRHVFYCVNQCKKANQRWCKPRDNWITQWSDEKFKPGKVMTADSRPLVLFLFFYVKYHLLLCHTWFCFDYFARFGNFSFGCFSVFSLFILFWLFRQFCLFQWFCLVVVGFNTCTCPHL